MLRCDFWFERGIEDAVVLCQGEPYIKHMVVVLFRQEQRDELGWNSDGAWWVVGLEQPGHFRVLGYDYRVPFGS